MNNNYPIKGVIHSKPVDIRKGKKDPTKTYEFRSLILEVVTPREYERVIDGEKKRTRSTKPELLKFDLEPWLSIDEYDIGEEITVDFFLNSNEYVTNEGVKTYMTKPKATFIKSDKVRVKTKEESTFTGALPPREEEQKDDDYDSLPF